MKSISKSRLKAEMLGVFRELERSGEELIVTDHGNPVLKISPLIPPRQSVNEIFSDFSGKVVYHDNILKPETEEWTEV